MRGRASTRQDASGSALRRTRLDGLSVTTPISNWESILERHHLEDRRTRLKQNLYSYDSYFEQHTLSL